MTTIRHLAARLGVNFAGLILAILLSVAMFTAYPANNPWINLIPGGIIWLIVTPVLDWRVARKRKRTRD